jgi:hypothetical protein
LFQSLDSEIVGRLLRLQNWKYLYLHARYRDVFRLQKIARKRGFIAALSRLPPVVWYTTEGAGKKPPTFSTRGYLGSARASRTNCAQSLLLPGPVSISGISASSGLSMPSEIAPRSVICAMSSLISGRAKLPPMRIGLRNANGLPTIHLSHRNTACFRK